MKQNFNIRLEKIFCTLVSPFCSFWMNLRSFSVSTFKFLVDWTDTLSIKQAYAAYCRTTKDCIIRNAIHFQMRQHLLLSSCQKTQGPRVQKIRGDMGIQVVGNQLSTADQLNFIHFGGGSKLFKVDCLLKRESWVSRLGMFNCSCVSFWRCAIVAHRMCQIVKKSPFFTHFHPFRVSLLALSDFFCRHAYA